MCIMFNCELIDVGLNILSSTPFNISNKNLIIQDTQTFLSKPYYIVTKPLKNFRTTHFITSAQGDNTYYCQDNIKHSSTHCIHITSMVTAPLRHSIWWYSLVLRMSNSGPYWNLCGIK